MSVRRETPPVFQRRGHEYGAGLTEELSGPMPPDELSQENDSSLEKLPTPGMAAFSVQIHQTLDAKKVVLIAAHELRPILGCDRVCFLERHHNRFRLTAASDQPGRSFRSRQGTLLEQFVAAALPKGERFLFPDKDLALPESISRPLAAYWENAAGQLILVEPVFANLPETKNVSQRSVARSIVGALVIEQFHSSELRFNAIQRLDWVMDHLTPALTNARQYSRMTGIPGLYLLGQFFELIRRNRSAAMLAYLLAHRRFSHRVVSGDASLRDRL